MSSLLTGATTAAGAGVGTGADVGDGAADACAGAGFVGGTGGIPCGGGGLVFTETDSIRVSWSALASVVEERAEGLAALSRASICSCGDRRGECFSEGVDDICPAVDRGVS